LLYYQKFTGNLTGPPPGPGQTPNFIPGTVLLFEQPGLTADTTWPHVRAFNSRVFHSCAANRVSAALKQLTLLQNARTGPCWHKQPGLCCRHGDGEHRRRLRDQLPYKPVHNAGVRQPSLLWPFHGLVQRPRPGMHAGPAPGEPVRSSRLAGLRASAVGVHRLVSGPPSRSHWRRLPGRVLI